MAMGATAAISAASASSPATIPWRVRLRSAALARRLRERVRPARERAGLQPPRTHAVSGDGRTQCDQVNVQWSCGDVTPEGGGFAYIPGSQKALYPMPVDERVSMDLSCVRVPALDAGDVLLFGGVTHGAAAWREDPARSASHRRAVIHFYNSKEMSLGPGNIADGATPRVAPAARM